MQVEGPDILPEDVIRVIDDMAEVHRIQKSGCGWTDDMALVSIVAFYHTSSMYGQHSTVLLTVRYFLIF